MATKVTCYEPQAPSTTYSTELIEDDYVVTCDGSAYVSHVVLYPNGTHVITVKRPDQAKPGPVQHVDFDRPK